MNLVNVRVFHLEMLEPHPNAIPAPLGNLAVLKANRPSVGFYRFLYSSIGQEYHWLSRRKLSDPELAAILNRAGNEVHVLYADGNPAGMAELDRDDPAHVELLQFGLFPEFLGMGLGKYLLQWTLNYVWRDRPRRFWVHTCTLDHPRALPMYQKAGFRIFKEEVIQRPL